MAIPVKPRPPPIRTRSPESPPKVERVHKLSGPLRADFYAKRLESVKLTPALEPPPPRSRSLRGRNVHYLDTAVEPQLFRRDRSRKPGSLTGHTP